MALSMSKTRAPDQKKAEEVPPLTLQCVLSPVFKNTIALFTNRSSLLNSVMFDIGQPQVGLWTLKSSTRSSGDIAALRDPVYLLLIFELLRSYETQLFLPTSLLHLPVSRVGSRKRWGRFVTNTSILECEVSSTPWQIMTPHNNDCGSYFPLIIDVLQTF